MILPSESFSNCRQTEVPIFEKRSDVISSDGLQQVISPILVAPVNKEYISVALG
jgi:hypothetical protein